MQVKRKNGLTMLVIAVAFLLCFALAVGVTGALYQARRQATGTLVINQGIIIEYNGFSANQTWTKWEKTAEVKLFEDKNIDLGSEIQINQASIKANEKSLDFYARLKLDYKFYSISGEPKPEAQNEELKKLIKTSTNFFDQNWVPSTDGWFYYGEGSTLKEFKNNLQPVNLFATDAKLIVDGENITIEGGDIKIEITLLIDTLQVDTLQGSLDPETNGWEIITMLKLNSEDCVIDNTSGIYTPNSAFLANNPQSSFAFSLNEKTAVITGYVGSPQNLVIPTNISVDGQEYTTTSIGDQAFSSCSSLTSITIPSSVTSIGKGAFSLCESLQSITIPNSVTSIEEELLGGCTSLKSITFGRNVKSIGNNAFGNCSSLTSITIPNSVITIGTAAFSFCESLESITIPESVESIGTSISVACAKLTSITVAPENGKYHSAGNCLIETATKKLIAGCQNSQIPKGGSVVTIGEGAFVVCANLKSIEIPEGVSRIETGAFSLSMDLNNVVINSSVKFIGGNAFGVCNNLITNIGEGWVKASDNTISVDSNTLLKDISDDIKRVS